MRSESGKWCFLTAKFCGESIRPHVEESTVPLGEMVGADMQSQNIWKRKQKAYSVKDLMEIRIISTVAFPIRASVIEV